MTTFITIIATISIILISLILFIYINKNFGIIFFILGIIILYNVYGIIIPNKIIDKSLNLKDIMNYHTQNKKYLKNNNNKINLPIYYINLDRSIKRNKFMKKQFDIFDIKDVTRVSAIDGNKLNNNYFINNYPDMSKSEIGCTLSHIKAIRTAYENNQEYAVIMEDDNIFYLIPYWVITLAQIISIAPSDWEIIKLFNCTNKLDNVINNFFIKHNSLKPSYSTLAYIINKKGMEKILNKSYSNGKMLIKHHNNILKGTADQYIHGLVNTYDIAYPLFLSGDHILQSTIHIDHEESHINRTNEILKFYNSFHLIDKPDIKQLLFTKTLYDMNDLLENINVPYYLGCGTLLGAYRDNKFISYDSDIDVHVHINDYKPILEKESENFKLVRKLGNINKGYELTFLHKVYKIKVDIFFVYDKEDYSFFSLYFGRCDKAKDKMCRCKIHKSKITKIPFLNSHFPVPDNIQKYLTTMYGENWNIPIKYNYNEGLEFQNHSIIQTDFPEKDRKNIPKQTQKYNLWPRKIMEMKKPIIWLYWQNKSETYTKPPYLDLCLDSVKKYCDKNFEIIVLNDEMIPIVSRVIDKNFTNIEPLAMRADYIRFCLLYEYGGIWLDSDIVIMKDLSYMINDLKKFNFVTFKHNEENDISIGMIAGNKNNLYCKYMKICFEEDEKFSKWKDKKYSINWAGPTNKIKNILKDIQVKFPLEIKMYPASMIYPVNWKKSKDYYWGIGNIDKKILNLPAVYLHNQMYDEKHKKMSKKDVLNSNFRISDLFNNIL